MASGTQQHQHQYQPQQQQQQQQQQQHHPHHQQAHQELSMSQHQDNQMQFATSQGLNACLDLQPSTHHINNMSPIAAGSVALDQIHQPHLPGSDHDQIIDQVISLENDFSDPSSAMTNVDNDTGFMINNQRPQQHQQQHPMGDTNFTSGPCMSGANQLSSLDEDNLLNLLLEFECNSTNMISGQQLDQDEKMGIETIRKQLMSCEVQTPDHLLHNNSISPTLNQISSSGHPQQVVTTQQPQVHQSHHGAQQQNQLVSRTAPIMSHNQQHQLSTAGLSQQRQQPQHHRLSVDQTLLHGSYTNPHLGIAVPVSSSGQSYNPQGMSRITQSTSMSIDNNSPSPSWQQPQLSPYSPQTPSNDPSRPPSQRQQHHPIMQPTHSMQSQQHPTTTTTTSPHIQQLHHPLQRISPSQSISPPATTEPSPVVKKNPLLNAQLVNSRVPSVTPTRFINNQTKVLDQNPILNSKLSQSSFATTSCNTVGSPVNPSLNPPQPPRYVQQQSPLQQQSSSFSYDITQQQNSQQHTPPQTGYMSTCMYGHDAQQQQTNQICTSPSGVGLSQRVKQEIRKKVHQHPPTSLLKQLLSDEK